MFCVGADTQSFSFAFENRHYPYCSTVMKRLLTGYAMHYNRRHKRYGHLFQDRYKSILCQEDSYLLELTRYVSREWEWGQPLTMDIFA